MNLYDDVVYRRPRLGPFHQLHPGRSRRLVRHHDRLHNGCLLGYLPLMSAVRLSEKKLGADIDGPVQLPGEIPPFCGCSTTNR
jgi:hypothetical protein